MNQTVKTFYIFIILFLILTFILSYFINIVSKSKIIDYTKEDALKIKNVNLTNKSKVLCSTELTYCFEDNDCLNQCDSQTQYSCIHGICKNFTLIEENPKNNCDITKGFLAYLVGNIAFGTYDYICKTIDPGIALSINENLMCKGQLNYEINYIKKYPSIFDCTCSNQSVIPATSEKREHIECDNLFYDLIEAGQY